MQRVTNAPRVARIRKARRAKARRSRFLLVALAIVAVAAIGFSSAVQGLASLDGKATIERARTWTDEGVPYSQTASKDGYRTDCSGFVSMAWDLPENLTTWRIPLVAHEITKDELRPGDVLLDWTSEDKHVVIFERWASLDRSSYWALESSGHPDIKRAIRREVPYPYVMNESHYRPYRYVGMDDYWENVSESARQPVRP